MSDIEEHHRTPQESAERLADSLEANTTELSRVRKRYRLTMALLAAVALTLVVVIKFNYDGTVSRCETGNAVRVQIDEKWQAITDFIEPSTLAGGDPDGPRFLALLSEDLDRQDCSDINWLGR